MQSMVLKEIFNRRIDLEPCAQTRPRFAKRGKYVTVYELEATTNSKKEFVAMTREFMPEKPSEMPIRVEIEFVKARPKAHYNKKGLRKTSPIFAVTKPDIDNYEKFILDAFTGHLWVDDSQVVQVFEEKRFAELGETPYVMLKVYEIENNVEKNKPSYTPVQDVDVEDVDDGCLNEDEIL